MQIHCKTKSQQIHQIIQILLSFINLLYLFNLLLSSSLCIYLYAITLFTVKNYP